MGRFLTQGEISPKDLKKGLWEVTQPFRYETDGGQVLTVPVGFVTDGASVPRPLWWFLPAWGVYQAGAVLHDWAISLYVRGVHLENFDTREKIDDLFLQASKDNGTPWFLRNLMYIAIRVFGWRGRQDG
jgi:hypothetical protein